MSDHHKVWRGELTGGRKPLVKKVLGHGREELASGCAGKCWFTMTCNECESWCASRRFGLGNGVIFGI